MSADQSVIGRDDRDEDVFRSVQIKKGACVMCFSGCRSPLMVCMCLGVTVIVCQDCGRKFENQSAFHYHHQKQHSGKYVCRGHKDLLDSSKECTRKCGSKSELQDHLNSHENRRNFACPEPIRGNRHCKKGFNTWKVLKRHIERKHKNIDASELVSLSPLHSIAWLCSCCWCCECMCLCSMKWSENSHWTITAIMCVWFALFLFLSVL